MSVAILSMGLNLRKLKHQLNIFVVPWYYF
jgi:hypothetical protein